MKKGNVVQKVNGGSPGVKPTDNGDYLTEAECKTSGKEQE